MTGIIDLINTLDWRMLAMLGIGYLVYHLKK